MNFKNLFSVNNDIDEKNLVGFLSFAVMILFAVTDIVLGILEKDFHVTEIIYNSFLYITVGVFGISEAGKTFRAVKGKDKEDEV